MKTKAIKKCGAAVLMVCMVVMLLSGTVMAAWGVSGSCRGTTTFDVSTNLISVPSITIKPSKCGYINYGNVFSQGNWGDYTIKVTVLKGNGRNQTVTTYWNLLGNSSCGTKISLCPNSTYRITVIPKKLGSNQSWASTAFWELSSVSGIKNVSMR